eukprot:349737-Chlamydomonas_euryale.AAC.5
MASEQARGQGAKARVPAESAPAWKGGRLREHHKVAAVYALVIATSAAALASITQQALCGSGAGSGGGGGGDASDGADACRTWVQGHPLAALIRSGALAAPEAFATVVAATALLLSLWLRERLGTMPR